MIAYRPPLTPEKRAEGIEVDLLWIDFYQVGSHENFHSELKKYLKAERKA
ncbi:hypothetical protein [Cupriavidus sp. USMAHM13]|nr:hypothetical protein [Cupriavidus sp. USMAHM13]